MKNNLDDVGFEEIDHTADWAYRVWGRNLEELFTQAILGLYTLAGAKFASGEKIDREIEVRGIDSESLLVATLNELLHLQTMENLGVETLDFFQFDSTLLKAKLSLKPLQEWIKDIKAVTYHNIAIKPTEKGLEVTIVLDV
ncbi:protein of unknown function DUF101 [Gloeothece citriformis PCC 7424]|uniref:Archease domain-containing protein n=1 Tax=Gloeothece citriformis (strain PCC 7424) TaxID=65393 RepID=B7KD32_GLOC7|nr:archease [Gloeothece citriformis]ACK73153.1 protein of unknown function DUF101 [Gloeothece citriformis PCC 7424]